MTSLVVISFTDEKKALDASRELAELESSGAITIYEKVIVKKDPDGKVTVLESETTHGLRTLTGMSLGSMMGAFTGPIGLVIGIFSGALAGAAVEADYFDFAEDFTRDVIDHLQAGTAVIVAEIYEEGPDQLDVAMQGFGAAISRSNVDYVHDEFVDGKIKAIEVQLGNERKKIRSAVSTDKAAILRRMAELKDKRRQRVAELKQKENTVIGKIRLLANEKRKARLVRDIAGEQKKLDDLEKKLKKTEN